MLVSEQGQRRQLQLELACARAALAEAGTQLARSRDAERQARHLSRHDGLTALANRGWFHQQVSAELSRVLAGQAPGLALCVLDLDAFKPVNDRHGHDVGDQMLRIVAARLQHGVRADDLTGRLGGDEFGCLLTGRLGRTQVGRLARQLIAAVAAPMQVGALLLAVRPSLGIALCPADGTTPESLFRCADAAMYRAKRAQSGLAFHTARCGSPEGGRAIPVRRAGLGAAMAACQPGPTAV